MDDSDDLDEINDPEELLEMKVDGLVFDPLTNTPIIILKDDESEKTLPIWVGYPEATAIALEMESVTTPRPMTHDLIKQLLDHLDATVNHIVVNDLQNNTFFAVISIEGPSGPISVDSRPSDAIAVALRVGCPIFVAQGVIERAQTLKPPVEKGEEGDTEEEQDFRKWLKNIKPSDFGNMDQ